MEFVKLSFRLFLYNAYFIEANLTMIIPSTALLVVNMTSLLKKKKNWQHIDYKPVCFILSNDQVLVELVQNHCKYGKRSGTK